MNSVERGRWKLVIRMSTARKRWPGVMKSEVSPANGRMRPRSSAALSRMRAVVVPTQTMRPPFARDSVQRLGRRFVDRARLRVHLVVARVLRLDGQKRARADMQGDATKADAARRDPFDQGGSEMQASGRRRDGAGFGGEHRLVVGAILFAPARGGRRCRAAAAARRGARSPRRARRRRTRSAAGPRPLRPSPRPRRSAPRAGKPCFRSSRRTGCARRP